jgi:hypothetical protein
MNQPLHSPANNRMTEKLRQILDTLLERALQRGFFGTAAVEISVQDGTIQHIRYRVEQLER